MKFPDNYKWLEKKIEEEGQYFAGEYKGYAYRILRMGTGWMKENSDSSMLHLCGYVLLPKGHKFYRKHYDKIPVDCHGGLTYSRKELLMQPEKNTWYIGFDCAHSGDISYISAINPIMNIYDGDTYKDMEYVKRECKRIINQLLKLTNEK